MNPESIGRQRRLRVVHVYFHLDVGGIEILLVDLLPRFDAELFEVQLICTRRAGLMAPRLEAAGVPVHVCRCHSRIPMALAVLPLTRLLRRLRPDIVHAHAEVPSQFATMAARAAGVPVLVVSCHSSDLFPRRGQLRRERRQARQRDATIHVSQSVQHAYSRIVGPPGRSDVVIYNGIDIRRFSAELDSKRQDALRCELRIEGRRPVLLKVARLQRVKAHRDLLHAFRNARARFPDAVLLLAGEGRRRGMVEAAIRELGLGDSVRLLGQRSDTPDLYQLADLHVISSIDEGFSVAVLEAMAAGLPQVLTDVGGNREAVGDSGAALLVPPGDPDSLSRALLRVLEDPRLAQSMRHAARERVEMFGVERQVRLTEQLYLDVARRKGLIAW